MEKTLIIRKGMATGKHTIIIKTHDNLLRAIDGYIIDYSAVCQMNGLTLEQTKSDVENHFPNIKFTWEQEAEDE